MLNLCGKNVTSVDEGYQLNKLNKNGVEKHLRRRSRNSLSGFSDLNFKGVTLP